MNCADNSHVTGLSNTVLDDASWYRVDSRLVTIDGLGTLLVFIKSLLSALWLVDDSAAVSLRHVLTRDLMDDDFLSFLVSSFCCSSCCLPCHLMVDTCTHGHPYISSHGPLNTSSHPAVHTHFSPILTCCIVGNPRKWCPVFHSPSLSPSVAATFWVHLADPARQGEIRILILIPSNELLFSFPFSFLFVFLSFSFSVHFLFIFFLLMFFFSSCTSHVFFFFFHFSLHFYGEDQSQRSGGEGQARSTRKGEGHARFQREGGEGQSFKHSKI